MSPPRVDDAFDRLVADLCALQMATISVELDHSLTSERWGLTFCWVGTKILDAQEVFKETASSIRRRMQEVVRRHGLQRREALPV
eukprot:COSAG01_NODE_2904_length_6887_cov_2.857543_11_plen_85_part_00